MNKKLLDKIFGEESQGPSLEERARSSTRIFVRSQDHLAFDNSEASGLKLSAWQAFNIYGLDILQEVVEYGSAILPIRSDEPAQSLKRQRTRLGLSEAVLANALHLEIKDIQDAEDVNTRTDIFKLSKIAQALALDEIKLGFVAGAGADNELALRLKEAVQGETHFTPKTVLAFDEAAWVIRKQSELAHWLQHTSTVSSKFKATDNYGHYGYPAWAHGYYLAREARKILKLDDKPIESMRELIGRELGIPIIQLELPTSVGGATIAVENYRGIAVNISGTNQNEWVRRATLAHELGHLLWDPDEKLLRLRVDKYDDLDAVNGKQFDDAFDVVEARANAFAIEFLAPQHAALSVFEKANSYSQGIRKVMEVFGLSFQAARYHLWNASDRRIPLNDFTVESVEPTAEWKGRESYTIDYFKPEAVPFARRGRFAYEVVSAEKVGLITNDVAALYLSCDVDDYEQQRDFIKDLFD